MTNTAAELRSRPFGLVLAGGRASRMGGGDKALHVVGDRSIYQRIAERLETQCDGWALSARSEAAAWALHAESVLPDPLPGSFGPLAGVLAGLRYLKESGRTEQLLLTVPGDAPFLPDDLVSGLVAARTTATSTTAFAASNDRRHFATALWPVSLEPALDQAIARGPRSVETFHAQVGFAVATWPASPFDPFFNVNTPDDLARAEQLARLFGL